jgi:hypothetical protein
MNKEIKIKNILSSFAIMFENPEKQADIDIWFYIIMKKYPDYLI